jgi:hypothetical protein
MTTDIVPSSFVYDRTESLKNLEMQEMWLLFDEDFFLDRIEGRSSLELFNSQQFVSFDKEYRFNSLCSDQKWRLAYSVLSGFPSLEDVFAYISNLQNFKIKEEMFKRIGKVSSKFMNDNSSYNGKNASRLSIEAFVAVKMIVPTNKLKSELVWNEPNISILFYKLEKNLKKIEISLTDDALVLIPRYVIAEKPTNWPVTRLIL